MTVTSTRWLAFCVWLSACVMGGAYESASAQGLPPKVVQWQGNASNQTVLQGYGILGEVAQPGVFSSSDEVTLQRLIRAAGGLQPQASSSVRIIRAERGGQTLFYNPNGSDRLYPGDFVVVDRRLGPLPGGDAASPQASVIWIGLAGVSRFPVVVPIEPRDAQLGIIMEALGQSPELARSSRVMLPPGSVIPTSSNNAFLPSGTVIAIPSNLVVWGALPPGGFPEATPLADVVPVPPAPSLVQIPQLPMTVPGSGVSGDPITQGLPTSRNTPFDQELNATPLPFSSIPVTETPANPTSLPAQGSRLETLVPTAPSPPVIDEPVTVTANLTANLSQQIESGEADIVGEMVPPAKPVSLSFWHLLGIAGTLASLVGVALGTRHYLDVGNTSATSLPLPASTSRISPEMFAAAERAQATSPQSLSAKVQRSEPIREEHERVSASASSRSDSQESLADILNRHTPIEIERVVLPESVSLSVPQTPSNLQYAIHSKHANVANSPHLPADNLPPHDLKLEIDPPANVPVSRPHFAMKPPEPPIQAMVEIEKPEVTSPAADRAQIDEKMPPLDESRFQSPIEKALARLQRGGRA